MLYILLHIFFALYRAFEFPFAQTLGPESIHNIYNVPLEPERAAKARRAVVASVYIFEQMYVC